MLAFNVKIRVNCIVTPEKTTGRLDNGQNEMGMA